MTPITRYAANAFRSSIAASATKQPGTLANNATLGTVAWAIPSAPFAAGLTLNAGGVVSEYLSATGFGFNIPTNATILGVSVGVSAYSANGVNYPDIVDTDVTLLYNGNAIGGNRAKITPYGIIYPGQMLTYGGASDSWGVALTPANINNATFGVGISLTNINASRQEQCGVGAVTMTVYYEDLSGTANFVDNVTTTSVPQNGSGLTTGVALIDQAQDSSGSGQAAAWNVVSLSVSGELFKITSGAGACGQLGKIVAGLLPNGTAGQNPAGWPPFTQSSLPQDMSLVGDLFDPAVDNLPPEYTSVGAVGLPVSMTLDPSTPIAVPAGSRLCVGIWAYPSLLAANGYTPLIALMLRNAQYRVGYQIEQGGQGPFPYN